MRSRISKQDFSYVSHGTAVDDSIHNLLHAKHMHTLAPTKYVIIALLLTSFYSPNGRLRLIATLQNEMCEQTQNLFVFKTDRKSHLTLS